MDQPYPEWGPHMNRALETLSGLAPVVFVFIKLHCPLPLP